eukprot:530732_1
MADFEFNTPLSEETSLYSWQRDYFGEGGCRYAFAGRINKGSRKGTRIVVKKWKQHHVLDESFWDTEVSTHTKAKDLIEAWNDEGLISKKYVTNLPFKIICTVSSHKRGDKGIVVNEWCLGEDYLEGDWEKWNSNSGFVCSARASVQAFCHWTYHHSDGALLMCDAQGIRANNKYYITDPCICSKSGVYGLTDCGERSINSFFANHKCNLFCKSGWKKPSYIDHSKLLPKKKTSTYKWNLKKKTGANKLSLIPQNFPFHQLSVIQELNRFSAQDLNDLYYHHS